MLRIIFALMLLSLVQSFSHSGFKRGKIYQHLHTNQEYENLCLAVFNKDCHLYQFKSNIVIMIIACVRRANGVSGLTAVMDVLAGNYYYC